MLINKMLSEEDRVLNKVLRVVEATKPGLALSVVYLSMFYCIVVC